MDAPHARVSEPHIRARHTAPASSSCTHFPFLFSNFILRILDHLKSIMGERTFGFLTKGLLLGPLVPNASAFFFCEGVAFLRAREQCASLTGWLPTLCSYHGRSAAARRFAFCYSLFPNSSLRPPSCLCLTVCTPFPIFLFYIFIIFGIVEDGLRGIL